MSQGGTDEMLRSLRVCQDPDMRFVCVMQPWLAVTAASLHRCSFHLNTFEAVSEYRSWGQDVKTRGDLVENKITADHFFRSNYVRSRRCFSYC